MHVRAAVAAGTLIAIDTDAHARSQLRPSPLRHPHRPPRRPHRPGCINTWDAQPCTPGLPTSATDPTRRPRPQATQTGTLTELRNRRAFLFARRRICKQGAQRVPPRRGERQGGRQGNWVPDSCPGRSRQGRRCRWRFRSIRDAHRIAQFGERSLFDSLRSTLIEALGRREFRMSMGEDGAPALSPSMSGTPSGRVPSPRSLSHKRASESNQGSKPKSGQRASLATRAPCRLRGLPLPATMASLTANDP